MITIIFHFSLNDLLPFSNKWKSVLALGYFIDKCKYKLHQVEPIFHKCVLSDNKSDTEYMQL